MNVKCKNFVLESEMQLFGYVLCQSSTLEATTGAAKKSSLQGNEMELTPHIFQKKAMMVVNRRKSHVVEFRCAAASSLVFTDAGGLHTLIFRFYVDRLRPTWRNPQRRKESFSVKP